MTGRALLGAAALVASAVVGGAVRPVRAQATDTFPHLAHAKVFPACTGCHLGIETGNANDVYPAAVSCARCHDGQQTADGKVLRGVSWPGAHPAATNLTFSHPRHAEKTQSIGSTRACLVCHARGDTTQWMNVAGAASAACLACHAHASPAHLADEAQCRTCHVPLADATALTAAAIAGFPKPASHAGAEFLSRHAPADSAAGARCAICHTQESCARCHMNAATLESITDLGSNPRVTEALAGKGAVYPTPAGHGAPTFTATHGAAARAAGATCGSCHAQASCRTCHLQTGARREIETLPRPRAGGAQGVQLRSASDFALFTAVTFSGPVKTRREAVTVRVHPPGFSTGHGAAASTNAPKCTSCHVQRYCADCHDGAGRLRYHATNFVLGHAAQAYGREQDCASCHNTQAFCLGCHQNLGLASTGRRDGSVHNQTANWLLEHGQAARLELPNCVSCHKQSDCTRCHSTTGWNVNPHGPNFNANRMAGKNRQICYYCHVSIPTSP